MTSSPKGYCCLILLGSVGLHHSLSAETIPSRGVVDARVRVAVYDDRQVYALRGTVGYQIDLEFEPGEAFVGLGAGDIEGLAFQGQENHLFLKPKAVKVATNLTILTSRRHYQIDYSAFLQRPQNEDDVIYALRFTYPVTAAAASAEAEARQLDSQLENASAIRPRNVDYWYCGQAALRPIAASDDGVHTRLTFAAESDLPAIFVRNEDGESLLNFSMDAGDVIIHRVAPAYILRRGKLTGCIVNRGYHGNGARLESGTVAPQVQRRVQGSAP